MQDLARRIPTLCSFLIVVTLASVSIGADLGPADQPSETRPSASSSENTTTAPETGSVIEVERLQAELDKALAEIERLKATNNAALLSQPDSLAAKSDGDDPLDPPFLSEGSGSRLA